MMKQQMHGNLKSEVHHRDYLDKNCNGEVCAFPLAKRLSIFFI